MINLNYIPDIQDFFLLQMKEQYNMLPYMLWFFFFLRVAVYKKPSNQRNRYFSTLSSCFSFSLPSLSIVRGIDSVILVISQTLWYILSLIFVCFHLIASKILNYLIVRSTSPFDKDVREEVGRNSSEEGTNPIIWFLLF